MAPDTPPPRLRFDRDLVVALSAIVISASALWVSVEQTRVMREQSQASVWPRVALELTVSNRTSGQTDTVRIVIRNSGVGPAKIVWARWLVGVTAVARWDSLLRRGLREAPAVTSIPKGTTSSWSSIGADVLSPGATRQVLLVSGVLAERTVRIGSRAKFELCYCSVFDACWLLRAGPWNDTDEERNTIEESPDCGTRKIRSI